MFKRPSVAISEITILCGTNHSVRFWGFLSKFFFFIQKAVNLSSESLLALTKQVSTCFEDFMNISWFYLIKVKFSGHFWPYTLSAPSCTWFLMIGMLVGLKLFIISWVWVHICAPVKFLTFFPTWASNRNLIFQAKLQNSLCSCTSWGYMCNTNEICDTYPESSWYKLLKNARKNWNNHKSLCALLDNFGQKYSKTDTVFCQIDSLLHNQHFLIFRHQQEWKCSVWQIFSLLTFHK